MSESKAASSSEVKRFVLANNPKGLPKEDDWKLETVDASTLTLSDGEVLLTPKYISVDPYLRGVINGMKAGGVQTSIQLAEVVESKNDQFEKGAIVVGWTLPWQTLYKADVSGLRKIDPKLAPHLSCFLGVLGMPGQTAYFGLYEICKLKAGDVVVVSGAAGAVGSLAGQLAKLKGCFVVGTASGSKCKGVEAMGFDVCLDYTLFKTPEDARAALAKALGGREVNAYFDNTGGPVTHGLWPLLAKGAHVAICGQISVYNAVGEKDPIPDFLSGLIYKQINIRGFVVSEFLPQGLNEFYSTVGPLVASGKIKYAETVMDGFDTLPQAFIGLFTGKNVGKMVVKV